MLIPQKRQWVKLEANRGVGVAANSRIAGAPWPSQDVPFIPASTLKKDKNVLQ
jgi:hypothetical protein